MRLRPSTLFVAVSAAIAAAGAAAQGGAKPDFLGVPIATECVDFLNAVQASGLLRGRQQGDEKRGLVVEFTPGKPLPAPYAGVTRVRIQCDTDKKPLRAEALVEGDEATLAAMRERLTARYGAPKANNWDAGGGWRVVYATAPKGARLLYLNMAGATKTTLPAAGTAPLKIAADEVIGRSKVLGVPLASDCAAMGKGLERNGLKAQPQKGRHTRYLLSGPAPAPFAAVRMVGLTCDEANQRVAQIEVLLRDKVPLGETELRQLVEGQLGKPNAAGLWELPGDWRVNLRVRGNAAVVAYRHQPTARAMRAAPASAGSAAPEQRSRLFGGDLMASCSALQGELRQAGLVPTPGTKLPGLRWTEYATNTGNGPFAAVTGLRVGCAADGSDRTQQVEVLVAGTGADRMKLGQALTSYYGTAQKNGTWTVNDQWTARISARPDGLRVIYLPRA